MENLNLRRKKRGLSELPPPPTEAELRFQSFQFDDRISGQPPKVRLGGQFFNSTQRDRSLKYSLSKKFEQAKKLLS